MSKIESSETKRKYKSIIHVIKSGRLNLDKHGNDKPFMWYGRELQVRPFYCDNGHRHCGYSIRDTDPQCKWTLDYDFDLQPSFQVLGYDGQAIYEEND